MGKQVDITPTIIENIKTKTLTVLLNTKHKVRFDNPNATEKLISRKIINTMKEKRNSKSGLIKDCYQWVIMNLEEIHSENYPENKKEDSNINIKSSSCKVIQFKPN